MRVVIFANGAITEPSSVLASIKPNDKIIAANGGLNHCISLGFLPDTIIGDFDSIDNTLLQDMRQRGATIIQHPARKDFTDLELAMHYAQELGADEILLFGALGARWDQTLANLLLPASSALSRKRITILAENQEIHFMDARKAPTEISINGKSGDTVSLIPLVGDASGITTRGLEYPLEEGTLALGATRGVSNVMQGDSATIKVKYGLLICIVIHHSDGKK